MIYEWSSSGEYYKNNRKYTGYERDWATNLDNAKARTFNHNRGRFLQPDPLGVGAADATNPQSLNRYSYVGNDPANFVDPRGLLRAIYIPGQACVDIGLGPVCETYYTVIWIDDGFSNGGPLYWDSTIGGGGGGGGQEPAQQKTGCEDFVDKIVNFSMGYANHVGLDGTPDGGSIVANSLVSAAFSMPRKFLDGTEVNYKDPNQISGFKPELTANNQNHDAFRHIQASAGLSMSSGGLGGVLMAGFDLAQTFLRSSPVIPNGGSLGVARNPFYYPGASAEERTAIKDDLAGIKVGFAIGRAFGFRDFSSLKANLMGILCQTQ
jgi:RHS repeat-associated protein